MLRDLIFIILSSSFLESDLNNLNYPELECMVYNVYHEAAGEPFRGKLAVANVTKNRVNHPKYPNTVCSVVKQAKKRNNKPIKYRCQFSWYCDEKSDRIVLYKNKKLDTIAYKALVDSVMASYHVLNGNILDNTGGATHYLNPDIAKRRWQTIYTETVSISDHTFYKREKNSLL